MTGLLQLHGVSSGYGHHTVLHDVSLSFSPGSISAVIGHNGAGKSTLLKTAFGLVSCKQGSIEFDGAPITRLSPTERLHRGIVYVPQGVNIFASLTVEEHFRLALGTKRRSSDMKQAYDLFPDLQTRGTQPAGTLSGGQRQMVAVATALLHKPRLMLVDEPSIGLSPLLVTRMMATLRRLCDELGVTVVVVEQNVSAVLEIADQLSAIRQGELVYNDTASDVRDADAREVWALL